MLDLLCQQHPTQTSPFAGTACGGAAAVEQLGCLQMQRRAMMMLLCVDQQPRTRHKMQTLAQGESKAACWPLQTACHLTLPPLKQSLLCSHRLCGHRPCSHRWCTHTTGGLLPTCSHASRCHHRHHSTHPACTGIPLLMAGVYQAVRCLQHCRTSNTALRLQSCTTCLTAFAIPARTSRLTWPCCTATAGRHSLLGCPPTTATMQCTGGLSERHQVPHLRLLLLSTCAARAASLSVRRLCMWSRAAEQQTSGITPTLAGCMMMLS